MAILDLVYLPDPRLRAKCDPVETVDAEIRTLARDMLETMYDAPGIGLAAPQVGVLKRVIVVDVAERAADEESEGAAPTDGAEDLAPAKPNPMVLINPEVVAASEERSTYQEGCLSIPEIYEDVERPAAVRVRYLTLDGETAEIEADGLLATCLQHEIDHINGVLFIDYLSRLKRDRITRKFTKLARLREKEAS